MKDSFDEDNIYVVDHYADSPELIKHKMMQDNTWIYFPGGRPENITPIVSTIKETILAPSIIQKLLSLNIFFILSPIPYHIKL